MRMKKYKNKVILGIVSIVVLVLIIFGYSKIKEYYILKDVFVFSKDNVVSIWRVKKGESIHDYDYKLPSSMVDYLSSILTNSTLQKATINDSPSQDLGSMTILLDGKREDKDDSTTFEWKRRIILVPIDKDSVYVFLEVNKLRDDDTFNMEVFMQKTYIIDSKELVEFIDENTVSED